MFNLPAFQLTKSNKDNAEKGEFLSAVLQLFPGADNDPNMLTNDASAVRESITFLNDLNLLYSARSTVSL